MHHKGKSKLTNPGYQIGTSPSIGGSFLRFQLHILRADLGHRYQIRIEYK